MERADDWDIAVYYNPEVGDGTTSMRQARTYQINGRVQGVGFRYFTWEAAAREGLTGFVMNAPDGSVEALAEGEREALERFEAAIWRGPAGARVHHVERDIGPATGNYHAFSIRG